MCNKVDNNCREEKRGCEGCYYEKKLKYNDLLNTLINTDFLESACSEETANEYKQAIEQLIYENMRLLDIKSLHEDKIKFSEQLINCLKDENKTLKEITNNYDVICKNDADYILIANKSYFDKGIFKNNLIHISKIINLKKYYEEQAEETKMAYGKLRNISNLYRIYR